MNKDYLDKILCKHGIFNVLKNDQYICKSLAEYGEWSELEVDLYKDILKPNDVIIEVGSHIGTHTLPLAKIIEEGHVYAIEPQILLFNLLNKNLKENNISCVTTYLNAVSNQEENIKLKEIDYEDEYKKRIHINSGGLDYRRLITSDDGYEINVIKLDSQFKNLNKLEFIKIDAEGNEFDILKGSQNLLERFHPIIYCEFDLQNIAEKLKILNFLNNYDYVFFDHITPLFNINNFKKNEENIFGNTISAMFLSVPKKKRDLIFDLKLAKHNCKEIDLKTLNLDHM